MKTTSGFLGVCFRMGTESYNPAVKLIMSGMKLPNGTFGKQGPGQNQKIQYACTFFKLIVLLMLFASNFHSLLTKVPSLFESVKTDAYLLTAENTRKTV